MSLIQKPGTQAALMFLFIVCFALSLSAQNNGANELIGRLDAAIKQKELDKASEISLDLANNMLSAGDKTSARKYFLQCLGFSNKAGLKENSLAASLALGKISFETADFNKAVDYFEGSAELATDVENESVAYSSYLMMAESHASLRRFKKAVDPVENALKIAVRANSIERQVTCYELLKDFYSKSGNARKSQEISSILASLTTLRENEAAARAEANARFLEAKDALEQKAVQEDALITQSAKLRETEESLRLVEALHEKSQLEIGLLSKDRELALMRIQEQSTRLEYEAVFRNAILVVIILGSSLIGVLVVNYRKKVKTNKRIDLQNKNIKSSINYAKRIQEAMLPKKEVQESLFKDSFILFKPRDVVSGDFYWFTPLNEDGSDFVFGAIDCTGHGVPGAFMSMIGINSLNSIINRGITHTDIILETLHQEIRNALQQDVTGNNDGMDLSLCIYRSDERKLEFSGAKSPLVYIQDGTLKQIKGDVHSIGGSKSKPTQHYKKHVVTIDRPTMVYLFTDGYRDQFGGEENQKFMGKRFSGLLQEIHSRPLSEQYMELNSRFEAWKGSGEQTDDVLVMGVLLKP